MQHIIKVDLDTFPEGFHSRRLATSATGIDSCMVLFSRVPPGHHGPKLHTHAADQLYYIVKGSMKVQLGTEVFTVEPGNLVFIPEGTPHCNWNDGTEDELHLEVFAPAPPPENIVRPAELRTIPNASELIRKPRPDGYRTVWPGFILQQLAQRSTGSQSARLYIAEFGPASGGPKLHFHDFDQFYFILEGSMEIQVGNRKMTAGPNSLVVLPAGTLHTNFNLGPGTERHIALLVPEPPEGEKLDYRVELLLAESH
jgi:mannose-6-phosphate isomerase-like protein (cupin superfamily)